MPDVYCYAHNISEGGMALSTSVSFSPGEEVRVEFTLPETKTPYIAGSTICWSRTGHLGLRFTALSEDLNSELQEWLSQIENLHRDWNTERGHISPNMWLRNFRKRAKASGSTH
jgi:hypothetical protein